MLDHVPDHMLDHLPGHVLDHMIIGFVATALHFAKLPFTYFSCTIFQNEGK